MMNNANMQSGAPAPTTGGGSNKTIIVIVVVVVILLCCCLIGAGAFAYSRYVAGKAISNFNNQLATAMPNGAAPGLPPGSTAGQVPTGGLGDELTRTEAWGYALTAIVQVDPTSCQSPDPASTTIEVTQQPDSSGAWQERWTVACGGGKTIPVDISFTPAGGGLFSVKAAVAK